MTERTSPNGRRGGARALGAALSALLVLVGPNLPEDGDADADGDRSGAASGWTARVDSVKLPINGTNSSTYSRGYIAVRVASKNGTPLQGVEIRSWCGDYWKWNKDVTGDDGRAWIASHCGDASPNQAVDIKLTYNNQSATFRATTGHRHFVSLLNDRDPVTVKGRLLWAGTEKPLTDKLRLKDDGNQETIAVDGNGRFREELPEDFKRGEDVSACVHFDRQGYVNFGRGFWDCGYEAVCSGSGNCWTIPRDGDYGTLTAPIPHLNISELQVKWRGSGRAADGEAVLEAGGTKLKSVNVKNGKTGSVSTSVDLRKPTQVTVKFTPSFVPGLTYRKTVTIKPRSSKTVTMKVTPPELVVSGGVVDESSQGRPVKADVRIHSRNRGDLASTTSSQTDGSFRMAVNRWSDRVEFLQVEPDERLYDLPTRKYKRPWWVSKLEALTSAVNAQQPKVVRPGKKVTFRMTNLALEVSGEMKPMAVEGRLQWKKERLRDQVGNASIRRSHSFQDRYPLGQMDVIEYAPPTVGRIVGGQFTTYSPQTPLGSTRLRSGDNGKFRVEFGDYYGSRTVQLFFTPASLPTLTYQSKSITVQRGTNVQREISHPRVNLDGSIRDPDGCAVAATVTFYPKIPWTQEWHQSATSSSDLDEEGENFSATIEHVPIRKVVIEPTVNYLQTKTFTGREWRQLLDRSVSTWDPTRPDTLRMWVPGRPAYSVWGLDIELDYMRPSVGPGRDGSSDRKPDRDRDGIPNVVEQHLADVHTPSYEFDRTETVFPDDLASYLRNSFLMRPIGSTTAGAPGVLGGDYFLMNLRATPSLGLFGIGPAYVRVMKLDAARLENTTYRIAYGLWYDRGRHGPHYLPPAGGRAFRGDFKEVLVDVRRGKVQQVFLRNYGHDGAGERTISGIPFDLAANSYTYGPGGVTRHGYDPLVESDELDRLEWPTFGRHEGDRRPQYFYVYVAAGTHNQFLRPGKTFIRPKHFTLNDEAARKVQRALFGTTSFVPQLHRGGGGPPARRGTTSVASRPNIELLGTVPGSSRMVGSARGTTPSVDKPSGKDINSSLLTFPGYWGQSREVVRFSDRKPATVWLSTAGPGPMRYDTENRLGDAPGGGRSVNLIPEGALERAERRAQSGGTLFGNGYGGNLGGSGAGSAKSGAATTPPGGSSKKGSHLYAWSGDATFQYVIGTCIDATSCSFPGGTRRTGASPGRTGTAPSSPEIGGEASGFAQDYPASDDAYLDTQFFAHALGEKTQFLRVTSLRQTPADGGSASTATSIRWRGSLHTFASLPPGTYLSYELVSQEVGLSLLGFGITSELSLKARLDQPTVTRTGGGTTVARTLDAQLFGSWSILQIQAPGASVTPIQVKQPHILRSTINMEASPESLSSYLELSANFKATIGVGSGVSGGRFGVGSDYIIMDLLDYRIADTRFYLLQ